MRLGSVETVQDTGLKHLHKAKMMDADGVMSAGKHERLQEPQAECETTVSYNSKKGKHMKISAVRHRK